jgi:Domain of unknown function (DUF4394)
MLRPRILLTVALAGLAAAVLPTPAGAATQSFAGILDDGRLVRFTSEAPTALTTPIPVRGLEAGEQLLALGGHRGRLYALGSSARLYTVDPAIGRAAPTAGGRPLAQGLRGRRFSLAITPDGAHARIVSDVGQDVFVDLASGAETPGPGVRGEDGAPLRPAVTIAPDGRLVGFDVTRRLAVRETQPGSGVLATSAPQGLQRAFSFPPTEPSAYALDFAGRGFLLTAFTDNRGRDRQSQVVRFEPAAAPVRAVFGGAFLRRLTTIGALGQVPEDTRPPRARITVPRTMSLRALLRTQEVPATVRVDEAAQVIVSLRIGARGRAGFGLQTLDIPTSYRRLQMPLNQRDRRVLRRAAGRRIRVAITTGDFAGNGRTVIRSTRLTR